MTGSARRRVWVSIAVFALAGLWSAPGVSLARTGSGVSASPARGASGVGEAHAELQRRLEQVVAAGAPGIVALVRDGDRGWRDDAAGGAHDGALWRGASGVADLRTQRPMRPDVRFRVGSVTKSFVATVALQLVAQGRLSLSDTVERWLPGLLPYGGSVTVRELLNHTSGVPDDALAPVTGLYRGDRFRVWQPRELVELIADQPPEFPAGSQWSYSNTNYVLVGMIIERVTGHELGGELQRRIFAPLHLRDTSFPVNVPFLPWPYAHGYSLDFDAQMNPIEGQLLDFTVFNPSLAWGAGNIVSDIEDIARFYRALLRGRLLPPAQLAEMKSTVAIGPGAAYGLGILEFDTPCGPIWGHDGGIPGFSNQLFSSEDGSHQYGLMINAEAPPVAVFEPLALANEQAWQDAFAGMPCATPPPPPASALSPPMDVNPRDHRSPTIIAAAVWAVGRGHQSSRSRQGP
jgi:D-alanyl-D-alanine carboxypeptidase